MKSFNTNKMKLNFGETYTTGVHKLSKNNVVAIPSMSSLTNKNQAQSFIGMINYLSKFSLKLSEIAEPTRELSRDKVPFNWNLSINKPSYR